MIDLQKINIAPVEVGHESPFKSFVQNAAPSAIVAQATAQALNNVYKPPVAPVQQLPVQQPPVQQALVQQALVQQAPVQQRVNNPVVSNNHNFVKFNGQQNTNYNHNINNNQYHPNNNFKPNVKNNNNQFLPNNNINNHNNQFHPQNNIHPNNNFKNNFAHPQPIKLGVNSYTQKFPMNNQHPQVKN